jgi:hypothetical protein
MSDLLESYFHNLRGSKYIITSPVDVFYNCVAFAAGVTNRVWWPENGYYWPSNVTRSETLAGFVEAFATLGYSPCADGALEDGFEKVAIYADENGVPTHVAKQLASGTWSSKCGMFEDIEHDTLEALEGSDYGTVAQFLKRPQGQTTESIT